MKQVFSITSGGTLFVEFYKNDESKSPDVAEHVKCVSNQNRICSVTCPMFELSDGEHFAKLNCTKFSGGVSLKLEI